MKIVRAFTVLALVGVLTSAAVPTVDACAVAGAAPHECCASIAKPESAPPASCCGAESSPPPLNVAAHDGFQERCDCFHPPADAQAAAAGIATPCVDSMKANAVRGARGELSMARMSQGPQSAVARDLSPPPLFILDCAFLI